MRQLASTPVTAALTYQGSCHCGAIDIRVDGAFVDASECNCSICRRTGALWLYRSPSAVTIVGNGVGYVHGDAMLTLWHCATCGVTTHWTPADAAYDRMGVNLRLFASELWINLARRQIDGASW